MNNCVFCEIVRGNAPADLVTEWHDAIAIHPLHPVTEGHLLVIPRRHVNDFADDPNTSAMVMSRAAGFVARLDTGRFADDNDPPPYDFNLITSKGANATQTVFHLHVHLVPRRAGDGLALPWTEHR